MPTDLSDRDRDHDRDRDRDHGRHDEERHADRRRKDGGVLTISGNLKSFEGPVLNCRDSTDLRRPWVGPIGDIPSPAPLIFIMKR